MNELEEREREGKREAARTGETEQNRASDGCECDFG